MLQTEKELHDPLCQACGLDNMISELISFKKPEVMLIDPILVNNSQQMYFVATVIRHHMVGCITKVHIPLLNH